MPLIIVPGLLISGNTILRMHWAKRLRLIRQWRNAVAIAARQAGYSFVSAKDSRKFHIRATRYASRFLDVANFATALDKLVIDGLCDPRGRRRFGLGIIYDDGPEWLTVEYAQQKIKCIEPPSLTLEIQPIY